MHICEKYGLNRISLVCIVKIGGGKCPKYRRDEEGEIVEIIQRN